MKTLIKKSIMVLSVLPLLAITTLYAHTDNVSKNVNFHSNTTTNPALEPQLPESDINRGLQDRLEKNRSDLNRTDHKKIHTEQESISPDQSHSSPTNPTQFPGSQTPPLTTPK